MLFPWLRRRIAVLPKSMIRSALPQGSFEATLEAAPFLGLSAEGIASGVFAGNLLRFSLIAVEGPGHFSLWRETSGGPGFESRPGFVGIPIASSDGIDANDFVDLPVGLHEHVNWGFSAPGRYDVTFSATGELIGGGVLSAHGTFRFEVDVPLHSTDLNGDGVTDRRDLVAFVSAYGTGGIEGSADFTGDGLVGIADLVALRAALVSPNETVAVAVPEPSGITSAIVGAIAFLFKRRKSRPIDSCN
jgi:surface-anchored protein